ncbi:MAG TPA: hypothetical protein DGO89_03215 [Microcoleaceae bacterium UBA9251]|jgi:Domain of Unknown Function (DUF928).|nr:hypothetical protein [Microcoleaceae cyanobacterium UBA9251]
MKRFLHLTALAIALSAIVGIFPSLSAPMPAKSAPIVSSQNVNFKPPNVTAPGNRQGATHRGPKCPADLSITPLIPESNVGLTLSQSPTLFAYVSHAGTQVQFSLITEKETKDPDEVVYETAFKVDNAGIIAVTIPAAAGNKQLMEVGKRYQWSLAVACSPGENTGENMGDRSNDLFVTGSVERIETQPSLKNDLANPDPMARLSVYAKNGIWYETVATLAEMRRKTPDDAQLTAEWTQLLQSQKLDSIANQPLVQSF